MLPRILLVGTVLALLNGCVLFHKKRTTEWRPAQPQQVGTVAMVNDEQHFVLVDVGSLYTPAQGRALKTFTGSVESGVVSVSGEKQQPFIAADIVKGAPQRGDLVFE